MRSSWLRAAVLLFFALVGFAQPSGWPTGGPRKTINVSQNTISDEALFSAEGNLLQTTRGVLMQAKATFSTPNGTIVPMSAVRLARVGVGADAVPCVHIGTSDCTRFPISRDAVYSLAHFVANGRVRAFTLPSDGNDAQEIIRQIEMEMVPAGDRKNSWIARELNAPEFVRLFSYVDFDIPFHFTDAAIEPSFAASLRDRLNKRLGGSRPESNLDVEDATYVNADIHAFFRARTRGGAVVCDGVPARYHWILGRGQRVAYIHDIEFASAIGTSSAHRALATEALKVFCTTAVLRAVRSAAPASYDAWMR